MNPDYADFAKALRKAMARAGVSRNELAKALNVQWKTVDAWVKGESGPQLAQLRLLPRVLGVTSDELLAIAEGADPPFESWQVFLGSPEAQDMTSEERRALVTYAVDWPNQKEPPSSFFSLLLMTIRAHR